MSGAPAGRVTALDYQRRADQSAGPLAGALLRWQPPHESAKNSLWDHLLSRVRPRYDPRARRDKGLSGGRADLVAAKAMWADLGGGQTR